MSRGIDRTTLLEELVGMLEHKKTREAQRAFHCHGCGEKIDEGGEFYFIARGKYCPECMGEAVEEARAWLKELEALPKEDEGNQREERGDGEDAGSGAGGDGEML